MFGQPASAATLRPLVGDLYQVAGVRRLVLDDGAERGVRVLHFDTGGGLVFWVAVDRALDLATLSWRGVPLAWQGPNGFRNPGLHDAEGESSRGLMRTFSGLLVTCGLDHIRQPQGGQPLHGRLPFTPARLLGYGEDWERGEPVLFCEGEVVQARLGGEHLRLRRRIEAPVGGNLIRLRDEVVNRGVAAVPQAMLYHINLGFPAVATGAELLLDDGERLLGGPLELPRDAEPTVLCRPVGGPPGWRRVTLRSPPGRGPSLTAAFATDTLPWLQTWLDPRPGTCALGIEPCTSDRREDGTSGEEAALPPGRSRSYALDLSVEG